MAIRLGDVRKRAAVRRAVTQAVWAQHALWDALGQVEKLTGTLTGLDDAVSQIASDQHPDLLPSPFCIVEDDFRHLLRTVSRER